MALLVDEGREATENHKLDYWLSFLLVSLRARCGATGIVLISGLAPREFYDYATLPLLDSAGKLPLVALPALFFPGPESVILIGNIIDPVSEK